jgi:GPH family glycoside/pentoside/hexuronide:cation symporter
MTVQKNEEKISIIEKIGFGLGDTASNLFFQTFMLFLLYFYTDVYGISAGVAGTMFLVTRIWDSVNDPIMGIIGDRTKSRWGKFRPYLLWLAIPFGIIGVLTFYTPDFSMSGKIIYAYVTYTLMMMIYTAINIPYSALMGVISASPLQRTSFSQFRFIFAFIGAFIVQGTMLPMVNSFGEGDQSVVEAHIENDQLILKEKGRGTVKLEMLLPQAEHESIVKDEVVFVLRPDEYALMDSLSDKAIYLKEGFGTRKIDLHRYFQDADMSKVEVKIINERKGFTAAMSVMAVLAVIMFLITFFTTKERVQPPEEQRTSLKKDLKDLLANKPWWILFALGIFTLSHVSIRNGAIMYYFKYYVGSDALAGAFMMAGTIATIASIMLTEYLSRLMGKKRLYIWSMMLTTIFAVMFIFLGKDDIVLMFILQILISFAFGPTAPLVFAMYTDAADYSEYKTGRRATGLVMSASTMAQKFGWTIGGAVAGWLLAAFGFEANVVQGESALTGIRMMMSVIPAIGSLLGGVLMVFYKLDDSFMNKIEEELSQRRKKIETTTV